MSISSDIIKINELLNRHYYKGSRNDYVTNTDGSTCFEITTDTYIDTEAYVYYDSSDTSLNFVRLEKDVYTDGQVVDTKTYYKGIETLQPTVDTDIPWYSVRGNITTVNFNSEIRPISCAYWFDHCEQLITIDNLTRLDTSQCQNMSSMFRNCLSLVTIEVDNFNTSKVTDMSYMFDHCTSLTSLDVNNFDTSKVTNMYCMFNFCELLPSLDVSNFNTSNVIDMQQMFNMCTSLTALNVSNFNTSNVTNMCFMFESCRTLTSLNVDNFNTSKVTKMHYMFHDCELLTSLNVSNFDTSNVTTMRQMFGECESLTILDIGNFNIKNITNIKEMFKGCSELQTINLAGWEFTLNENSTIDAQDMFKNCSNLEYIYISSLWNNNKITASTGVFTGCTQLPNFNASFVSGAKAYAGTGGYLTLR